MESLQQQVALVTLTPTAAARLRGLLQEKGLLDHGLRVFISAGGCSGLQYGMAFENEAQAGDIVTDSGNIKIYVDPMSAMYLAGAEIDYVDNLMGGGFKIENPNAVASCRCGHSFRTDGQAAQANDSRCGR